MSTRISKVNEVVRKELARIISREVEFKDALVTVMRVETDADLKNSTIFISVIPQSHEKGAVATLKKRAPFLQHQLNKTLVMRYVPTLSFMIEKESDTHDSIDEVEHILDQIKRDANK